MPRKNSKFTIQCDGCGVRLWKIDLDNPQLLEVSSYEELFADPSFRGWKISREMYEGETFHCPACQRTKEESH